MNSVFSKFSELLVVLNNRNKSTLIFEFEDAQVMLNKGNLLVQVDQWIQKKLSLK